MIIVTTNGFDAESGPTAFSVWPGPKILIILPGSGLTRGKIEHLNEDFIILEYLQKPANTASVLCDVTGWMGLTLEQADWPLLYLDRPFDSDLLSEQAELGRKQVHALETRLSEDGRIVMIRLGEMIATSPLLPEFFRLLRNRTVEDGAFGDLLAAAFVWDYA